MTEKIGNILSKIISAIVLFGIVIATVFFTLVPQSVKSNPNSLPTDVATLSAVSVNPLIQAGGAVDPVVLDALFAKVGPLDLDANINRYDSSAINGGTPVTVKLFETVTNTVNEINKLTAQYWQVVYRTGNILTLWMVEPYTTAAFDANKATKVYAESPIHDLINETYLTLDETFNLNAQNLIATPNDLPVKWQTFESEQPNITKYSTYNTINNLMPEALANDKLWLPSFAEVFNSTMTTKYDNGIWKTTLDTRAYTNNSTSPYTWLRSAYDYESATNVCLVDSGGGSNNFGVAGKYGVRPALHINLEALYTASLSVDFTLTSESYGLGTGLENEEIDFDYTVALRNSLGNAIFSLPVSNLTPVNVTITLERGEKYTIDIYGPSATAFSFGVGDLMFATPHLEFTAGALNNVKITPIKHDYTWSGGTDIL